MFSLRSIKYIVVSSWIHTAQDTTYTICEYYFDNLFPDQLCIYFHIGIFLYCGCFILILLGISKIPYIGFNVNCSTCHFERVSWFSYTCLIMWRSWIYDHPSLVRTLCIRRFSSFLRHLCYYYRAVLFSNNYRALRMFSLSKLRTLSVSTRAFGPRPSVGQKLLLIFVELPFYNRYT